MLLEDRAVLITGARRIGAAVGVDLARRGMHLAVSYNRSRDVAETVVAAARSLGRKAVALQGNVSRAEDCAALVARAAEALERLDVLINMASVYSAVPFDDTDDRLWDTVVGVDLRAAFLCARAAVPHLRRQNGGRIINFADWTAASGRPRYQGFVPYYTAKHAVIGLTEALALELAGDGILVNAIAPGPILAPEGTSEQELTSVESATPLGRWGGETEIVKAVAFLLESDFVTGETIRVDGGRHLR